MVCFLRSGWSHTRVSISVLRESMAQRITLDRDRQKWVGDIWESELTPLVYIMALDADRGFRRNLGTGKSLSFVRPTTSASSCNMKALPNSTCPLCGGANQCAPAASGTLDVECWCTTASISSEALAKVPADLIDKACLCPRCALGLDVADQVAALAKAREI